MRGLHRRPMASPAGEIHTTAAVCSLLEFHFGSLRALSTILKSKIVRVLVLQPKPLRHTHTGLGLLEPFDARNSARNQLRCRHTHATGRADAGRDCRPQAKPSIQSCRTRLLPWVGFVPHVCHPASQIADFSHSAQQRSTISSFLSSLSGQAAIQPSCHEQSDSIR